MRTRRLSFITCGIVVVATALGLLAVSRLPATVPSSVNASFDEHPGSTVPEPRAAATTSLPYHVEIDYVGLTRAEHITQAEAIVLGDIQAITPARWNQDSGAYWHQDGATSLPYHEVQVSVRDALIDTIGLDSSLTLIILGASPAGMSPSAGVTLANLPDHTLQVGDQAILFLVKRPLAWHGGARAHQATRTVLRLLAAPKLSYLTRQPDGRFQEAASLSPDGDGHNRPIALQEFRSLVRQRRSN